MLKFHSLSTGRRYLKHRMQGSLSELSISLECSYFHLKRVGVNYQLSQLANSPRGHKYFSSSFSEILLPSEFLKFSSSPLYANAICLASLACYLAVQNSNMCTRRCACFPMCWRILPSSKPNTKKQVTQADRLTANTRASHEWRVGELRSQEIVCIWEGVAKKQMASVG